MDTGLLNFGEEHFSFNTFDEYECPDDSTSDTNRPYFSEWDDAYERELNGDIALIPISSDFTAPLDDIASFTEAPPEIFERFSDWTSTYINIDAAGAPATEPVAPATPPRPPQDDFLADVDVDHLQLNVSDLENFDLAKYTLCDSPEKKVVVRAAPVKKIDIEAQKYIVEEAEQVTKPELISSIEGCEDLIDVETVLDVNFPVLEANDALGLLEQFEATETPILSSKDKKNDDKKHEFSASFGFDNAALLGSISTSSTPLDYFEKTPKAPIDIFEEDEPQVVKQAPEPKKAVEEVKPKPKPAPAPRRVVKDKVKEQTSSKKRDSKKQEKPASSKQILKALPQELIARINESGKRKTITVIPPIPNKKRPSSHRSVEAVLVQQPPCKIQKLANKAAPPPLPPPVALVKKEQAPAVPALKKPVLVKTVAVAKRSPVIVNDHDYCSSLTPYPKEPLKDSGFQSSEDDDRSLLGNQPMVKNADGKLMVSLLKVNTIKSSTATLQKKKLNLEEYKKKRLFKLTTTSQSTSSSSSACSSPLPEDENVKRIKHQEKLQKMALELLKTAPKSVVTVKKEEKAAPSVYPRIPESYIDFPYVIKAPPGLEVREVVNCGTNTDVSNVNDVELLESLKQLEEIEPLLKKASDKLNSNSFINAMIENIPKTRKRKTVKNDVVVKTESVEVIERKVHYLPVHKQTVVTKSIEIQTDFDELIEDIQERYRRRLEEGCSSTCSSSIRSKSPVSVKSGSSRRQRVSSPSEKSHRSRTYSSGSSSSSTYSRGRRSSRNRSSSSYSRSSCSSGRSRSRSRSFSPRRTKNDAERLREVEERRVIYVGGILPGTKKEDLRRRFMRFGPITNVNLHFRDFGDNYGFVTFVNRQDAFKAIEKGNQGGVLPRYDLSFGGRRIFCKTTYSDLDNVRDEDVANYYAGSGRARVETDSFDDLLRVCQERLKRKP